MIFAFLYGISCTCTISANRNSIYAKTAAAQHTSCSAAALFSYLIVSIVEL